MSSTATKAPKRLVRPRAWMSEGGDGSCMNPESYPTVRRSGPVADLLALGDRTGVERDDAAGHALPRDVAQTRLAHDLGDPIRAGVALDAPDEIAVGGATSCHAADDRHDPVEPELEDAGGPALRPRDLEAHDTPARADRPRHLAEPLAVVGQVAHPEGDRGRVELPVLGRQRERIADAELEPRPVGEAAGCHPDHGRRDVDAEDAAVRLGAPI